MKKRHFSSSLKHRISRVMVKINYLSGLIIMLFFLSALNGLIQMVGNSMTDSLSMLMSGNIAHIYELTGEFEVPENFNSFSLDIIARKQEREIMQQNMTLGSEKKIAPLETPKSGISLIEYQIFQEDANDVEVLIEDTYNKNSIFNEMSEMPTWLTKWVVIETHELIIVKGGQVVGELKLRVNPDIIAMAYLGAIVLTMLILSFIMMLSKVAIYAMSGVIIKPLTQLNQQLKCVADGTGSNELLTEISIKQPTLEVDQLITSTNTIRKKMMLFVRDIEDQRDEVEAQRQELEAQNILLSENTDAINGINNALMVKSVKMQMLMDNVDQGFFTFGANGVIADEYSKECLSMFGQDITGLKPSAIMFHNNPEQEAFVDELLANIFQVEPSARHVYIQLLPEEIYINNLYLDLKYKMLKNSSFEDTILVVATCVTNTRLLEAQMESETLQLKMVVKVLVNRNEMLRLIHEYERFGYALLDNRYIKNHEEILREVHTFKGSFGQYEMVNAVSALNALEEKLANCLPEQFEKILLQAQLSKFLEEDLAIINNYVGEGFMDEVENFAVKKEAILEVEAKVKYLLPNQDSKNILPIIRLLRYTSLRCLLGSYTYTVDKLAQKLNKYLDPFIIQGDDILIDNDIYSGLIKSFVHIIRNAVDHGIETEDERVEKGKPQNGRIFCHIHDLGGNIEITIGDDGRGIDVEYLKSKAIRNQLVTEAQAAELTDDEAMLFIFKDYFTTKESANLISGRGMGLAAVSHEVDRLNGTIRVRTVLNQGTDFIITVPYIEKEDEVNQTSPEDLIDVLLTATNIYMNENLDIELLESDRSLNNEIELKMVSAIISVRGAINALTIISINEALASKMVTAYMYEPVQKEEMEQYYADVLGEITNTIIGQAVGMIDDKDGMLHIGVPAMMQNEGAIIKYTQHDIHSAEFSSLNGDQMSVSLFLMDEYELEDEAIIEEVINNG